MVWVWQMRNKWSPRCGEVAEKHAIGEFEQASVLFGEAS